ncbi:MAG: AzlC family ABC transporter permease [Lachnospiraceae bacterium]
MKKEYLKLAFVKSIPIMCSYFFVSMAYGIMMEEAGFYWYYSLLVSMSVYTGAFQFVLISFLSSGASLITVGLTAFLMNSRQTFYSLTFLEDFKEMGKKKLYMIHTMTDETYAVNCTLKMQKEKKHEVMFGVALLSRCYWMLGAAAGGVLGQLIPFDLNGIDFCMTALFIIIFIDQWERTNYHLPAQIGILVSVICLFLFGQNNFMLPALLLISGILMLKKEEDGLWGHR